MNSNKQYKVSGVTSQEFNQALDLVNPKHQDFINVGGIFVIKLSEKEATKLCNSLPVKAQVTKLPRHDYLQ